MPQQAANAKQHIGSIALLVRDYDEAIEFYRDKIGFVLIEDTRLDDQKRWVLMAPPGSAQTHSCLPGRLLRNSFHI